MCVYMCFSSVQFLSRVWLFATPWTAAHQASLSISNSRSLLKLMSIESVMLSNHLILCHPLLLPPSTFPSIRFFSNESVPRIKWLKYWNFSYSISPSNEYSGLISFRMDWLGLFGTLKRLLQYHSSKASILRCSAFFIHVCIYVFIIPSLSIPLSMDISMSCLLWIELSGLVKKEIPHITETHSIVDCFAFMSMTNSG